MTRAGYQTEFWVSSARQPRPPVSLPEGAVLLGQSLWVFPDPALTAQFLAEGGDPLVYGGRCVYYGRRLRPATRWQRLTSWLRSLRLLHPWRLVGNVAALVAFIALLRGDRPWAWVGGLVALLAWVFDRRTRGKSHDG